MIQTPQCPPEPQSHHTIGCPCHDSAGLRGAHAGASKLGSAGAGGSALATPAPSIAAIIAAAAAMAAALINFMCRAYVDNDAT